MFTSPRATERGKKYVIRLPLIADERYLCYEPTKYYRHTAVVYDHNDSRLPRDLASSGGVLTEVTGEVAWLIFGTDAYDNVMPSKEDLLEEYKLTLRGVARASDGQDQTEIFADIR